MNIDLPNFVTKKILGLTLDSTSVAWLLVGRDGLLKGMGGHLDVFGLQFMTLGSLAKEQALFLEAMLPLQGETLHLSSVEMDFGTHADIHLLPDENSDWVILLDRSHSIRWKAMAQQKANELHILRQRLTQQQASAPQSAISAVHNEILNHCQTLNMLLFTPMDDGSFQLLMPAQNSFQFIYPEALVSHDKLQPDLKFPFVENFLIEAKDVWQQDAGRIKSGPWIETDPSGNEIALEAMAVSWKTHKVLVLEILDDSYKAEHSFLQKGREGALVQQLQEKSSQAKSEFLSYMSHELRTPMNVIMGYAQLLETEEGLSLDQQNSIQKILGASNHLLELINELLDLSRIESGNVDLHIGAVNCADVLKECVDLMQPIADQRAIQVHYSQEQAQKTSVQGDFVRIKQVLLNLLSNAIKYNKEGGTVDINIKSTAQSRVRILLTDTGQGLSDKQKAALFQPYNRLGIENNKIEGTGIGLAISKQLVELMDGAIGVESAPGKGSTFWFELPSST